MDMQAVILSFNHPELTARCVSSCLNFFEPHQVLLIHNGSQLKFQTQLSGKFPHIQHLILNENRGFTGGANFALKKAFETSKWALFITNDCELLSINSHIKEPTEGLYAPLIYRRRSERVDSFGGVLHPQTAKLSHLTNPYKSDSKNNFFYVPGTAFLLDRNSFMSAGPFDESLGTYWEDVDFSLRCQKSGIPLRQSNDFVFRHGVGKTCHKHSYYTNYLYQRNRIRICRRWKAGGEFRFAKDTLVQCFKKARKGQWPEAWRRAKAHLDA